MTILNVSFKCRDFLKMKNVVIELANNKEFGYKFEVNETFWVQVEEIVSALQHTFNLTIEMQKVGYGLSDFYIGWLRAKKNLQRIVKSDPNFDLAAKLIDNMNKRAPSLFTSPLLLCAVYLDPRINFMLSTEQKAVAAMNLNKINERLQETSHKGNETADNTLDEILQEFHDQHGGNQNRANNLIQDIAVYEEERFDIKKTVMQFWEEHSQKYPTLCVLAEIMHAVPSNQTCTERAFSSFSYIRSKHRMSMSPQNLSNVLMVRLNKDIYYKLREERYQQILNA